MEETIGPFFLRITYKMITNLNDKDKRQRLTVKDDDETSLRLLEGVAGRHQLRHQMDLALEFLFTRKEKYNN